MAQHIEVTLTIAQAFAKVFEFNYDGTPITEELLKTKTVEENYEISMLLIELEDFIKGGAKRKINDELNELSLSNKERKALYKEKYDSMLQEILEEIDLCL
jgi:hypothetical protein